MAIVTSEKRALILEDVQSVARGAIIAGVGALLTYLLEGLMKIDFGSATPAVVALLSIAINVVRKYFTETTYAK